MIIKNYYLPLNTDFFVTSCNSLSHTEVKTTIRFPRYKYLKKRQIFMIHNVFVWAILSKKRKKKTKASRATSPVL